jgi:hypothetical protein
MQQNHNWNWNNKTVHLITDSRNTNTTHYQFVQVLIHRENSLFINACACQKALANTLSSNRYLPIRGTNTPTSNRHLAWTYRIRKYKWRQDPLALRSPLQTRELHMSGWILVPGSEWWEWRWLRMYNLVKEHSTFTDLITHWSHAKLATSRCLWGSVFLRSQGSQIPGKEACRRD